MLGYRIYDDVKAGVTYMLEGNRTVCVFVGADRQEQAELCVELLNEFLDSTIVASTWEATDGEPCISEQASLDASR